MPWGGGGGSCPEGLGLEPLETQDHIHLRPIHLAHAARSSVLPAPTLLSRGGQQVQTLAEGCPGPHNFTPTRKDKVKS